MDIPPTVWSRDLAAAAHPAAPERGDGFTPTSPGGQSRNGESGRLVRAPPAESSISCSSSSLSSKGSFS